MIHDMIFVILGTQKIPFPRLLEAVDDLIGSEHIEEEVVAQSGHTVYAARNFKCVPFMDETQFQEYVGRASVVITHSGSGSIFSAISCGRKVIAVARLHAFGEMIDDHQKELVRKLSEDGYILDGTDSLAAAWRELQTFKPRRCDFECGISDELGKLSVKGGRCLFVCNRGGHYSEMMCLAGIASRCEVWMLSDNCAAAADFGSRALYMEAFNYSGHRKLNFIRNFFQALKVCRRLRPSVVVSTGAGIAVPVFAAARILGLKRIFIESRARVYSKSRAGRILAPICDVLIVQWPEMLKVYGRKAGYFGTLS